MFTDKFIKALSPRASAYRKFEVAADPGFCVQVTPAGARIFQQQYTVNGKRRYLRLGVYPATSLGEARMRAREARRLIDQGVDPQAQRAQKQEEARRQGALAQLIQIYLAQLRSRGRRSADKVRCALAANVPPSLADMPARDVQPAHIRAILHPVIKRGARVQANRLRSYLHTLFRVGIQYDNDPENLEASVLFGIQQNLVTNVPRNAEVEVAQNRVLSWDEIRRVWNDENISLPYRLALRLILTTVQRPGEVIGAAWAEFSLEQRLWNVPSVRTKNTRENLIPLSPLAMEQLTELQRLYPGSLWLFPGHHNPTARKPLLVGTLSNVVQQYCEASGTEKWVLKDLRRTIKTLMGELGISKEIRDRLQNHALQDVSSRHYDRFDYLDEKAHALHQWSGRLAALEGREPPRPSQLK